MVTNEKTINKYKNKLFSKIVSRGKKITREEDYNKAEVLLNKELEKLRQQSLIEKLKEKKNETENLLNKSKNTLKGKLLDNDLELLLDTLLEIRTNIIKEGNDSLAEEKFESLAGILEKKISEKFGKETEETKKIAEELENIHQIQKEVTYLDEIIQSKSTQWEVRSELPLKE